MEMLSAVALVNQAVEVKDFGAFSATLVSPAAGLADIDDGLIQRYDTHCMSLYMDILLIISNSDWI